MAILHRKLLSAANSTSLYTCSLIDDCEDSYLFGYCLRCVYISPPPPPPPVRQKSSFLPYLISAVCALGVAFLILSTCTILLRYRFSRRRNPNSNSNLEEESVFVDEDHAPIIDHPIWHIVSVGLPQSVIDSIPTFKYKRGDGLLSEGSDCSVCLTEFEEDDHFRLLPKCSHAFHLPCIDTWLSSHKNCPLCRSTVENVLNLTPILGETSQRRDEFDNLPIEGIRIAEILKRNRENRVLSCDLGENSRMMNEPVRRSISLDASAALAITNGVDHHVDTVAGEETSSKQEKRIKGVRRESSMSRLIKSSSIGRSLQKAPVSMKRSLSSSAKIFSSFRGSKSLSCEMPYSGLKVGASF